MGKIYADIDRLEIWKRVLTLREIKKDRYGNSIVKINLSSN